MEQHSIGQRMSTLRKNMGFTQQEIANKLNVSNKTISCWERDASSPDISMLPAIAQLYGVTCDELLGVSQSSKPKLPQVSPLQPPEAQASAKADIPTPVPSNPSRTKKRPPSYEQRHKAACISAVFATLLAVCVSWVVLDWTRRPIWAFAIVAPVNILGLFVAVMAQSRVHLHFDSSENTVAIRSKMYFRSHRTIGYLLLWLAFVLPFCANLDYSFNYVMLGTTSAGLMLLLLIGVRLLCRIRYAEYYHAFNRTIAKRKFLSYCIMFAILIGTILISNIYISKQPLTSPNSQNVNVCDDISSLEHLLTRSYLPDYYVCKSAPMVSDQYAEYAYTVPKNKFRKTDVNNYLRYHVSGDALDDCYTVHILYPIWNVKYSYYDHITQSTMHSTKQIIVTHPFYQTANLEYLTDEHYRLSNFNSYRADIITAARNLRFTMNCALGAEAIMLFLFTILSICLDNTIPTSKKQGVSK